MEQYPDPYVHEDADGIFISGSTAVGIARALMRYLSVEDFAAASNRLEKIRAVREAGRWQLSAVRSAE
jgi:hypothetical protein